MYQVKVIIPIYRLNLSPMEQASILQTLQVLREHPILILHPENLNIPDNMFPPYVAKLAVRKETVSVDFNVCYSLRGIYT